MPAQTKEQRLVVLRSRFDLCVTLSQRLQVTQDRIALVTERARTLKDRLQVQQERMLKQAREGKERAREVLRSLRNMFRRLERAVHAVRLRERTIRVIGHVLAPLLDPQVLVRHPDDRSLDRRLERAQVKMDLIEKMVQSSLSELGSVSAELDRLLR